MAAKSQEEALDVPNGNKHDANDSIVDVIHDDMKQSDNSLEEEQAAINMNKSDDQQRIVLNANIITTDGGTLSYFGDEDHNKLDIRIIDTEEVKGKILKHTSFIIESSINNNHTVSRRYNDFKWLHNVLSIEYLCIFIPPIPPSNTASNILNKFDKEFISQRRYDLERFLNRIFNNKILSKSHCFEIFLTQQSQIRFEEQQKEIREKLIARGDGDIAEFIKKCYPELDFGAIDDYKMKEEEKEEEEEKKEIEDDEERDIEKEEDHKVYMEDIPRIREVYIRCDEKFVGMNKIVRNIFKIMTNIVTEINTVNEELYGLYDIENNEKPKSMENEWQKREEICEFINKWKRFEQNQMYCFYKYWVLNIKYEHQDCLAILDIFIRYDIVYNKYKKLLNQTIKQQKQQQKQQENVINNNNNNDNKDGVQVEESEEKKDDDHHVVNIQNDENKQKMGNIQYLLNVVCQIILNEQMPKLWENKVNHFNKQIEQFTDKYSQYTLDDDFV